MTKIQLVAVLAITVFFSGCRSKQEAKEDPLFALRDSASTGVGFINQLKPDKQMNIMDYLYFYNGGGVAVGDINNDGLTDVYFVSNQGKNKLYLNKGKNENGSFRFEDISGKAGIEGKSDWQTGATMADINGDGLLDIYVCAVGKFRNLAGKNELYINNGDLTFTEKAEEYGLDFSGFSTQAAFFDYDRDGDLDCYLLNHAVHTSLSYELVTTRTLRNNESGDYLFESQVANKKGGSDKVSKFVNVSEKAGIYGAAMGYGLGIAVADLNNDGWDDIYVSNDFHEDDYCYLNNGNGTFAEKGKELFRYTSRYSMGNDIADVNNDGFPDVMTLDMYPEDESVEKSSVGEDPLDIYQFKLAFGYMPQLSRNGLQINLSGKKFMEIAAMAGVAATDWSWSPLLADYDNDGVKDLFVSNGIAHRPNNLDYTKYIAHDTEQNLAQNAQVFDAAAMALMPEGKVHNYLFRGTKSLRFLDKSLDWGFEKGGLSNGAAYADFDNDGDLDLVTNNLNEPSAFYENLANKRPESNYLRIKLEGFPGNKFALGAKVVLKSPEGMQMQQLNPTRGFESSSEPVIHFGIGKQQVIDTLLIVWPDQKSQLLTKIKSNQLLKIEYLPTDPNQRAPDWIVRRPDAKLFEEVTGQLNLPYKHQENKYFDFYRESLMPFLLSTEGPKLAIADVNGDGLDDFYAGGAKWQAGTLFIQQPGGRFVKSVQADFIADSTYEDVDAVFFDANKDGHPDLYVASGGNEFYDKMDKQFDRLYLNDGSGKFKRDIGALPPMYTNKSCVRPFDLDRDGDLDLFVGGRVVGFQYGMTPDSYLLINDGKGHFTDKTMQLAPDLGKVGMVTDAVWADIDGDKYDDLVVVGDWMPVSVFFNSHGNLKWDKSGKYSAPSGFWQCVNAADFDRDGDMDLIVGNLGENNKFRKRPDSKLKMWVKDLDNNQGLEQILAYSVADLWYPVAFKDELGKRIPSIINKRFTDYKSIAGKTVDQIFDEGELKDAKLLEIDKYESVYLENKSGGFIVHDLPMEAQVSKLFTFKVIDINADGLPDILGGGNYLGVSTYQGRYQSSYGLVLLNQGKGNFRSLSPADTGFLLDGEIRDIKSIKAGSGTFLLVARNNMPISAYKPLK